MRIALISDLHGNLPALDAVLTDAEGAGVDEVICLGDIVDLGPQPVEVVDLLRERRIACIGGNHDPLDEHPGFPMLAAIETWTAELLGPSRRAWLEALPFSIERSHGGKTLLGVHGSPRSNNENMDPSCTAEQLTAMLEGVQADVVVAGHTHTPFARRLGEKLLVNVGSVGLAFREPFTGQPPVVMPYAEYGIVTLGAGGVGVELRRIAYDLEAYERAVYGGLPHPDQWLSHRIDRQTDAPSAGG